MPKLIYADSGSRSSFYIINSKRGFKTFSSYKAAQYAHNAQTILSQHDLAPKVYSPVVRKIINREREWGFETEIAEMFGCGGNECDCGKCEDIYESKIKSVNNLSNKIEKLGFNFIDNHVGNVGYVKRNGRRKLVCIDTGRESVGGSYSSSYEYNSCSCTCCRGE